ncbi:hypothetical protein M427DRAFT_137419 [Gonapodya prolifera JEL478]|uniref:Uncharacterized protein n=1 Tax=Gonapodya prolifera (strain JEL478) TaxID=1344416 RepID=A0A139A5T9_GONPJ|nr:hypothetical protein M427DRAFT_137419 [Gonapodya prolifera JEL478]|eukprot:KXS12170.1 hypothetical protein M427DRAFT_137419 [Gonapodya prolifera JEL478]
MGSEWGLAVSSMTAEGKGTVSVHAKPFQVTETFGATAEKWKSHYWKRVVWSERMKMKRPDVALAKKPRMHARGGPGAGIVSFDPVEATPRQKCRPACVQACACLPYMHRVEEIPRRSAIPPAFRLPFASVKCVALYFCCPNWRREGERTRARNGGYWKVGAGGTCVNR